MAESHPLIASSQDREDFLARHLRYLRTVENRRPDGTRKSPQIHPLIKQVREQLQWTTQRETGSCACVVIGVDEGDGMTWSAAAVEHHVSRRAPELPRHVLAKGGGKDGLPQVTNLIDRPRLVALVQESGLLPPQPALRRRWVFTAAILLLAAGALAAVVNALVRDSASKGFDPVFLLLGAAAAALVFALQELGVVLKRSSRDEAREKALKRLREAAADDGGDRDRLIAALQKELLERGTDRCVIVDDLDQLDPITATVLRNSVLERTHASAARELWLIFEDAEVGTLTKKLLIEQSRRQRGGAVRELLLRQRNLDEEQRLELATELGLPRERAEFRRVKWLVGRDSDSLRDFELRLDQIAEARKGDERAYGPLELLHMLAVDSTTGVVDFSPDELVADFSSKRSAHTREVLTLVLPGGTLERNEVAHAIERLKQLPEGILDTARLEDDRLEPVREAVEALQNRRAAYELEDQGLVHLFWAFYWFQKLGGRKTVDLDGYRLRKLGRHLLAATPPSALGGKLTPALSRQYVRAAIWTGGHLLRASLPEGLPRLLRLAEAEPSTSAERALLRRLCWQAFAVLGDESVLSTLVKLHPGRAPAQAVTELDRLFVDSTTFRDDAAGSRAVLSERLRSLDADVVGFARARALWLGLTLQSAMPFKWTEFSQMARDGCTTAEALVREALDRFLDRSGPRTACDALTISLGIWSYALSYRLYGGELVTANTLIEDVRLKALVPGTVDDDDFVLQGLLQEIEIIAGAAAAVILAQIDPYDLDPDGLDELERLTKHMDEAAGTAQDAEKAIAVRLSMLALTWTQLGYSERGPLGFEQLAAFATLRRAHFKLLCGSGEPSQTVMRNTLEGLSGQLESKGTVGLLAHAIGMKSAGRFEEVAAVVLTRGVDAVLKSGLFGTRLETELSLMAVADAHATRFSLSLPLRHLQTIDGQSRPETRLRARLEAFADDDRGLAALWCLNSVADAPDPAVARMVADIETLAQASEGPAREQMKERLHVFAVKRDIKAGKIDLEGSMGFWDERERTPSYAFTLHHYIGIPGWEQSVLPRALTWLKEHPDVFDETGPIYLAKRLVRHMQSDDPRVRDVLDYLDRGHAKMKGLLSAEVNEEILRQLLIYKVGDADARRAELTEWATIRQERDGLEKLPNLVSEGRFFLVIWHYYETLSPFGLATEPATDYNDLVWMSDARREELLLEWRASDSEIPPVTVQHGRFGRQLSGDFLSFGRMLFLARSDEDSALGDDRDRFDAAADKALADVYSLLIGVREMPEPLRRLLNQHRLRLLRPAARR